MVIAALVLIPISARAQVTRQISSSGSTQIQSTQAGAPGIQQPEIDAAFGSDDDDLGFDIDSGGGKTMLNRTIAPGQGQGQKTTGSRQAKSNPEVASSFDGLNFFNQRFSNNGNQFSVEPPDQALCVGNGYVLESVNDVLAVYSNNSPTPLAISDLNTFYGYPAAINRAVSPLTFGASITDPTCHFDPDTQRWFHVVLTLDRASATTQTLSGANHLDIAVSATSNPLGAWSIFKIPVQDDGTQGTPDHNCKARVVINKVTTLVHGPCLGDYPHIGMDKNGLYVTTNEFNLNAPGFRGSQIYAVSKQGLISGGPVNVEQFDTAALAGGLPYELPGFTVWGALSPAADFQLANGGTEYLLSSLAVFSDTNAFNQLVLWNLTNTQSLNTGSPAVILNASLADVQTYAVPPKSEQKVGDFPLGQCLADKTTATPFGPGCWKFFFVSGGPFLNPEISLPSNDSRMQQVSYANGKLWAALDTAVTVNGQNKAGAAFFVLHPEGSPSNLKAKVVQQGIIAIANNNVTYPAVAVNPSGRGLIGFTVLGHDNFPSAGYASLDAIAGAGDVHLAAAGAGPDDGFTGYFPEVNPVSPRWGDYGAAAVDSDGSIWFANEYTAQTCTLAQYVATNFTCGNTRGSIGNWATRVTHANVQ
jgi:hypothetical protein